MVKVLKRFMERLSISKRRKTTTTGTATTTTTISSSARTTLARSSSLSLSPSSSVYDYSKGGRLGRTSLKENGTYSTEQDSVVSLNSCSGTASINDAPWRADRMFVSGPPVEDDWWDTISDDSLDDNGNEEDKVGIVVVPTKESIGNAGGGNGEEEGGREVTFIEVQHQQREEEEEIHARVKNHTNKRFHNCGLEAWLRAREVWRSAGREQWNQSQQQKQLQQQRWGSSSAGSSQEEDQTTQPSSSLVSSPPSPSRGKFLRKSATSRMNHIQNKMNNKELLRGLTRARSLRSYELPRRTNLKDLVDSYVTIWNEVDDP